MPNRTVLGLSLYVVGGARISIDLIGIGLELEAPHSSGYNEAMPKLVLILREFEITGRIQR